MEDLLKIYTLEDILMFLILFGLAVKGFITFWDWGSARLRKVFDGEYQTKKDKEKIEERLKHGTEIMEVLTKNQNELIQQYAQLSQRLDMLIESDKDSIKSFLTDKHHYFCYEQKWIDDYSLECCERRFAHYQHEGGNSYIEGFMTDLRALPMLPPIQK